MSDAMMNWADWVLVGIIGLSCLISIKRGFFKEAISLGIWALAFFVAVTFHEQLAVLLQNSISTVSIRYLVAFGVLFGATLIVGSMVNYLFSELVKMTGLSGTDRALGVVFGLARGVIIVMAILIFTPMLVPVKQDAWWNESLLIPQFLLMETWSRETFAQLTGWLSSLL
ncbi:CvpA family protein [Dasania sp. GY-MA-18]|uniref:CvpA family protein n=1 Tax=Dasania phycosphaerae TaxID=2950436 RepID=A0A9J6RIH9_9GAMM|nr:MULTISPECIES: CvpA family protein [Dasania]MCR8921725.1 CvpA family protein [Dasania sp. GY-MA-18]MCZ0864153.1 CvpA family protein [Dasania phycosphaerae]MCZ0867881.1 CvpA family protein [Dasania phycosphaerae]